MSYICGYVEWMEWQKCWDYYYIYLFTCPLLSFISLWMSTIFTVLSFWHKSLSPSTRDEFLSKFLFLDIFLLIIFLPTTTKSKIKTEHKPMLEYVLRETSIQSHWQLNINKNVLDSSLNLRLQPLRDCKKKSVQGVTPTFEWKPSFPNLKNIWYCTLIEKLYIFIVSYIVCSNINHIMFFSFQATKDKSVFRCM